MDDLNGLQAGIIRIGTFSSVATHWLPRIISAFRRDYPGIEYEMLLGDYSEIETWIAESRVDFRFLRLPTDPEFETIELAKDELMAVIPKDHPLAEEPAFPVKALENEPFMLLEKGDKAEISNVFTVNGLTLRCKIHDLGRLCHHVHGGAVAWHQYTAPADPSAHTVRCGGEAAGPSGIPHYRDRHEKSGHGISICEKFMEYIDLREVR